MYEFLYKTAVCASRCDRIRAIDSEVSRSEPPLKRKRGIPTNRVFVVNAIDRCMACKTKKHPLYLCDEFKRMPVEKRIETVKLAKLCYNCLRSHRSRPCKFSSCTVCQKRHNTLLHSDRYATAGPSSASGKDTGKSE